jgi:hypothetical protein
MEDCYILKYTEKNDRIQPKDLLVLNEDGSVAIFPNSSYAYEFIVENDLVGAEVYMLHAAKI